MQPIPFEITTPRIELSLNLCLSPRHIMPFEGVHIRPEPSHPDWQPYSRGIDLLSTPSATSENLLAVARECATASLDSAVEDALSIMAATLYLRAHTVAGPTSGEGSSGKFEVDSGSFEAEYAAEILYGPLQGKDEDTIQRVSSIFELLNVKKFLKEHTTTKRSSTPTSSRARKPPQEDTSGPATTSTQEAQEQ
jgi:hypothetical protein